MDVVISVSGCGLEAGGGGYRIRILFWGWFSNWCFVHVRYNINRVYCKDYWVLYYSWFPGVYTKVIQEEEKHLSLWFIVMLCLRIFGGIVLVVFRMIFSGLIDQQFKKANITA